MGRFGNRVLTAAVAGGFAVGLAVGGGVPAGAAPASGQAGSMSDLRGAWVTSLIGFQAGDPVTWQHRLTVRKVRGAAAVAWEEWRDCADYAAACKAAKATGGGWSTPSRVLLVMGPKGVVRGVGATGTLELTPGENGMNGMTGMTAVMLGAGRQQDQATASAPASSSLSPTSLRVSPLDVSATKENPGAYGVSGVVGTPGCFPGNGLQPPTPDPCPSGV